MRKSSMQQEDKRYARLQYLREKRMRRQEQAAQPSQESPIFPTAGMDIEDPHAVGQPQQNTGMIQRVRIQRTTMLLTATFIFSDILGLVRSALLIGVLGSGSASAYFQAFLIPDTIFNLVAGGALGSAFIPVFTKYMVGDNDEKTAWHVSSAALNLAIAAMIVLALLAMIFAGPIIQLYNPPSAALSPQAYHIQISLIVSLARIMLLQAILLGGSVIISSILQARQQFLLPAIASALYNVGIIVGLLPGLFLLLIGHPDNTVAIYGATWGVVIGAALQIIIPLPGLIKAGLHYRFTLDWRHPGIIQIARQMVPRIINAVMLSFSTGVDRNLISSLGFLFSASIVADLITQYTTAFQIFLIPWSIFGATIATAAFPTLAENVARKRFDRYRATITETLRSILFLAIPSTIGLIVLGLTIVQVLFEHGQFKYFDATQTVYPLAGFAIGLVGLATLEILTRSFYALRDSKTPVIISIAQFILKVALSILLISLAAFGSGWGTAALAFSTSVATTLEAMILLFLLQQRIGGFEIRKLGRFILQVSLAAVLMGICLLALRLLLDLVLPTVPGSKDAPLGTGATMLALLKLALEVFVGLFLYLKVARLIKIEELGPVRRVLQRFKLTWI